MVGRDPKKPSRKISPKLQCGGNKQGCLLLSNSKSLQLGQIGALPSLFFVAIAFRNQVIFQNLLRGY